MQTLPASSVQASRSSFPPMPLGATVLHVLEKEMGVKRITPVQRAVLEKGILSQSVKRHHFKTPFLKGGKKKKS